MAKTSVKTIDFTISDDSINRYGYRIMTDGIELGKFETNPVAYFNHDTSQPSVGRWVKVWKADGKLMGTLLFDESDEFAMKLYGKYRDGFMNAVSLNVMSIEESDDEHVVLPGQRYKTVTKSELMEVSVVTLPGNANAVKLCYEDGTERKLSAIQDKSQTQIEMDKNEKTVEQLKAELSASMKLNADNLVALHKQRGVVQDGEVESLKELALANYETVSKMLDGRKLEAGAKDGAEQLAKQLVELHGQRLALTVEEKEFYEGSAKANYEGTKKALEARKGKEHIDQFVQGMGGAGGKQGDGNDRGGWTYLEWYKKDHAALLLMQEKEPEKYKRLEAQFLKESKSLGIDVGNE